MPDTNVVPIANPEPSFEEWATFDNFWSCWPQSRRVEKKDALAIWSRMKQEQREKAITVLPRWLQVHGPSDYRYLVSPRRWLHGERYEDELPAPSDHAAQNAAFKEQMDRALADRTPMPEHLRKMLNLRPK